MVSGVERAFVGCDQAVLHAEWRPWAVASAIVLAIGIFVCLLHSQGIVGARAISSSDIFFGTLAAGLVPRGIPGFVRLHLDRDGLTIQQIHKDDRIPWLDVVGSFSVDTRRAGQGVTFVRRNPVASTSPFSRITLCDHYGLSPDQLVDTLNSWRDRRLGHNQPA